MALPATVRFALATDASALLLFPWATTAAWTTSAESRPPVSSLLTDSTEDSSAPPDSETGPASPTTIGARPSTAARNTVASPLNVVLVAAVNAKAGGSCVAGPTGLSQLANSAAVSVRNTMRFMVPSFVMSRDDLGSGRLATRRAAVCREDSSASVGNYRWGLWEELPHAGSHYSFLRSPARSAKRTSSERCFRPSLSMTRAR